MNIIHRHIIGWFLYPFFLFLFFYAFIYNKYAFTLAHTIATLIFQMIVYYLNYFIILPKIYEKKHYFYYSICNIFLVLFGLIIKQCIDLFFKDTDVLNFKEILAHSIPVIITIYVSFVIYTFYKSKLHEKKELAIISAEKDFLIQQINPHFLFNTLNNIYSLTIDNDPKGSEAILQLSKMLDYTLYGGCKGEVTLESEIEYIKNFIWIFKLKGDDLALINFDYSKINSKLKIAPMLLIPFIENSFKHGDIENKPNGFIDINLKTNDNELIFKCSNTYSKKKSVDKTKGIGIQNVGRRLELIYPSNHELVINHNDELYSVYLKIKLDEKN